MTQNNFTATTILLLFLCFWPTTVSGFMKEYYCGAGVLSKLASFLATAVCNKDKLNLCCEAHDECYMSDGSREECDRVFCECANVANEKNSVCEWWIGVSHCRVVKVLGEKFYEKAHQLSKEQ